MIIHRLKQLSLCLNILLGIFYPCGGLFAFEGGNDAIRVYQATPGEPLSSQFVVTVGRNTIPVPVYLATVLAMEPEKRLKMSIKKPEDSSLGGLGQTSFTSFDLSGPAQVTVTCKEEIKSAKLLPSSRGIVPQINGNRATFTLPNPGQFVLEINGDWVHSLQLFANPLESDAPDPKDPNVIYFGPGIHQVTTVKVSAGKTVYIAPDAVVYGTVNGGGGTIFDLQGDHITLRGSGIIDGSLCPHEAGVLIRAHGRDISIGDVTVRDPGSWTTHVFGCDGVKISNYKIIGYRANSDGIDINDSRNIEIRDSYLRTADDLIVVKSKVPDQGETRNVTAERMVLWNELAHALSPGAEMRLAVDNIVFTDSDIIHDKGRDWLLRIYQCDSAVVSNVIYRNIRIEECQRLISLWIGKAVWSRDAERGHIENITFQNITSTAPLRSGPYADLKGFDPGHSIQGVMFDHVVVSGKPMDSSEVKKEFADGIRIEP